jgi:hypothetical protein
VSDTTKNLDELYDDIDLCYKVMGLTFSDTPDKVDRVYKGLVEEYTKELHSSDPTERQNAKSNLEQVKDLYERITHSLIYKDYAREYEKYKQAKAEQMEAKKQKQQAEKALLVNCPHCHQLISPKLKVCLYCHGKILSPLELVMAKVFTTRNTIIIMALLIVIAIGVAMLLNPQLGKQLTR